MKPRFITPRKFRAHTTGISLAAAIVVCLTGSAVAQTNVNWTGTTSTNWNTGTNWDAGHAPTNVANEHAVINTVTPHIATISGGGILTPKAIFIGSAAGMTGRVDHLSGTAATDSDGRNLFVGRDGGTGTYNLADTATTGGALTGFGTGTGTMSVNARVYIGGFTAGAGTGTVNVNTSGNFSIGNDLAIGSAGGTGVMNVDAGTITSGGWNFIGKNEGATGAKGTMKMSGGSFATGGRMYVGTPTCEGTLNLTGGTFTTGQFLAGGTTDGDGFLGTTADGLGHVTVAGTTAVLTANGEFTLGNRGSTADMTFSSGTVNTTFWTQVGRNGGHGTLDMSGGTWNKTGGGDFVVGDFGSATGTMTMTGNALVNCNNTFRVSSGGTAVLNVSDTASIAAGNEFWVGQSGSGTLNLSGGSITSGNWVAVGRGGGTGIVHMTGGVWTKNASDSNFIIGAGGTGTFNMSGGIVNVADSGPLDRGVTWVSENSTGTLNISGSAEFNTERFVLAAAGSGTGNLNLNGGTVTTGHILGGAGAANATFNGTEIIVSATSTDFIQNLDTANVAAGGLVVDTNGNNATAAQLFTGAGGVTKRGLGTLTLTGANTFGGASTVEEGKLAITTASAAGGALTVDDFAGLAVTQTAIDDSTTVASLDIGDSTALDFHLGSFAGNTAVAPLALTGALTVDGIVGVTITDAAPVVGSIPLISHTGGTVSSGDFEILALPDGVEAEIVANGTSSVSLNVTRVNAPYWTGAISGVWDKFESGVTAGTANWTDTYSTNATVFSDGDPAVFNDNATGTTDVTLAITVEPGGSGVTFNNSTKTYTLSGAGSISGASGLTKRGTGTATVSTVNDYEGVTRLEGGTLSIATLPDALTPGPIGAATEDPENLVFAGGVLGYTGTGATPSSDRGFLVTGGSGGIAVANAATNLTLNGWVDSTGGSFAKTGPGTLTLTNDDITLGGTGGIVRASEGSTVIESAGTQIVMIPGQLWVGSTPNVPATMAITGSDVSVGSWLTLGRGNGDTDVTSSLTITDSSIQSGNVSIGFNGDLPTNDSNQILTVTDTIWNNVGTTEIAESQNSVTTMLLAGASDFTSGGACRISRSATSNATVTIQDESSMSVNGGFFALGQVGTATMTVKDNGSLTVGNVDFNIGDVAPAQGTLIMEGNATVSGSGVFFMGKNANTGGTLEMSGGTLNVGTATIAGNATGSATITQTGGTVNIGNNDRVWFGNGGPATWNQSNGGIVNATGWLAIGRVATSVAQWNVSGAGTVLNHTSPGTAIILAEEGNATLSVSNGGVIDTTGYQIEVASRATGTGTLNVNAGGTLRARQIAEPDAGTSAVNFDGGTLVANADANVAFITGIDTTTVNAGGVTIDSNGQTIGIDVAMVEGSGGGGLAKTGTGTLLLNGTNTYTGATTVTAGTLGGNGSVAGTVSIAAAAAIAPGTSVGTFSAGGNTTVNGTYAVEIDGATSDLLAVTGNLDLDGADIDVTATAPTGGEWIIATYTGSLSGTVAGVTAGYTLDTATPGVVKLVSEGGASAYNDWATLNGLTPANNGPTVDAEFDGVDNVLEFVLGGNPLASDPSVLPQASTTATDFIFTFNRSDESEAEVTTVFQYGSSLTGWTDVAIGADNAGSGAGVNIVENAASPDSVTVTVPKGANTKLFGRLKAEK